MTREEFWANVYFQHIEKDFPEALADLALAEYDKRFGEKESAVVEGSDGWIPVRNSGQPVADDVMVDVKWRDNHISHGIKAGFWRWDLITHYRIHKD